MDRIKKIKGAISRRIHWYIVARTLAFAVAWLFLPWWLFFFVALYCYFANLFQPWKLFIPFACLFVLMSIQSPSLPFAFVFGAIFYYILLVRDLLVIDRKSTYEILVLTLSFLLLRGFFKGFIDLGASAFCGAFLLSVAIGFLLESMIRFFEAEVPGREIDTGFLVHEEPALSGEIVDGDEDVTAAFPESKREREIVRNQTRTVMTWLIILLSWQLIIIGLLLPLDFVYQSVIVFVAITFFYDLIAGHFFNNLFREKIFVIASVSFSILVILLASASWQL